MNISMLDVAVGPMIGYGIGLIIGTLLAAALAVFAVIGIIKLIKNKKGKQK